MSIAALARPRNDRPQQRRLIAAAVALGLLTWLAVAAYLKPSPTGMGTHQQLGLTKCGWILSFGKPCPTCGMTTAFAHAADGHFFSAFVAQPMGAVLALAVSAGFWTAVHIALTGSRLGALCGSLASPRVLWVVAGAAAVAWAYKLATVSGQS